MMVLQLLFVAFVMPETKGISLEELSNNLTRRRADKIKNIIGFNEGKSN